MYAEYEKAKCGEPMSPRYYSPEVIEQVQEANDIVDLVSEYVTLKKAGSSYKGCCPFHNEKTASFNVSQEKQLYHCFGCGAGGNLIGFVMAIENLTFPEAVQFLARRAGITLPENGSSPEEEARYRHRERLYELQRELANYYYRCLNHSKEGAAYFLNRGITPETIKAFGLGYAPNQWQAARDYLTEKGYTINEMAEAGIVLKSSRGSFYDRFRGRVMFPILNTTGRVIGFGGRRIREADKGPKYLNSPETPVFSKGTELFNLNRAKSAAKNGQILIVEGYMDVISLYQKGVANAVAALGTAFTPYHVSLLKRYAREVILCFDGDNAGEAATQKALAVLKKAPINVRILRLPAADDPDSFIQKNGREAFEQYVKAAITVTEYELKVLRQRFDLEQTDDRIQYTNGAIGVLRELEDPVQIDLYSKKLSQETGINYRVILREINRKKGPGAVTEKDVPHPGTYGSSIPKAYAQAQVIYLKAKLEGRLPQQAEGLPDIDAFSPGIFQALYDKIERHQQAGQRIVPSALLNEFEEDGQIRQVSAILMDDTPVDEASLVESIRVILTFSGKQQMSSMKIKAEMTNDEEAIELAAKIAAMKRKQ